MKRLALAAALASPLAAETQFAPEDAQILQDGLIETADTFIRPAYAAWADATADMTSTLAAHCGGAAAEAEVGAAYAGAFLAWQRASVVQLGPIMEAEGPMRVQLWPDPKGFSGRAVRAAVAASDPALLAPRGLEGRSIALTNLTALEHLVSGELAPGTYACDLAVAIAAFQADLAETVVAAWSNGSAFRADFDSAAAGTGRYASVDDLLREVLSGTVVYVDRLRKFKLERGLGTAPGEARPERTEAARSGLGLNSIAVGFDVLADLYEVPFGVFDVAPDIGGATEHYALAASAANAAAVLAREPRSLADIAAEDGAMAEQLRSTARLLIFHETYLKTVFPASIGLSTGFTSADGD